MVSDFGAGDAGRETFAGGERQGADLQGPNPNGPQPAETRTPAVHSIEDLFPGTLSIIDLPKGKAFEKQAGGVDGAGVSLHAA